VVELLEIACVVDTGKRAVNDDRAAVNGVFIDHGKCYVAESDEVCLAVVCDGVGGAPFGYKAAQIAAESVSRLYGEELTVRAIRETISSANEKVLAAQKADREHSGMATTVAGIYISGDDCIAFNVGDSRVYRLRTYLSQLSTDHSRKQAQIELGLIPTPGAEAELTRCIGCDNSAPEIVLGFGRVLKDDIYILCTDGVWGELDDDDFIKSLSKKSSIEKAAESLVDLAKEKGSQDNLSIIIIRRI